VGPRGHHRDAAALAGVTCRAALGGRAVLARSHFDGREPANHLVHRLRTTLRRLRQHLEDERLQLARDLLDRTRLDRWGRLGDLLGHQHRRHVSRKHRPPGEELVDDEAQRIDVAPRIDRPRHGLLGRHVLRRPHHHPDSRVAALPVPRGYFRHPEVQHLDEIRLARELEQHDVLGLEVPVDDPLRVRRRQRLGHLKGNDDGPVQRHRTPPGGLASVTPSRYSMTK
jgi:hypothetical protein